MLNIARRIATRMGGGSGARSAGTARPISKAGFFIKANWSLATGDDGVKTTKPIDRARGGGHLFPKRSAIGDAFARTGAGV
jgi:hypothetical protein